MNASRFDKGLSSGLLSVAQILMPPLVAVGMLLVLVIFFQLVSGIHVVFRDTYQVLAALSFVVTLLVFKDSDQALDPRDVDYLTHVGRAFGLWLLVIGILAFLGYALKIGAEYSRRVLLTWSVITPFGIGAGHLLFDRIISTRLRSSHGRRSAIIAGVNDFSRRLGTALNQHPRLGIKLLGFFDDRSRDRLGLSSTDPLLGRLDDISDYVHRNGIEVVYIALPITHEERTRQIIEDLQDTTVSIYFVPDIFVFDLIQSSVDMIEGIPILGLCESPYIGVNKFIKKSSDMMLAFLLLAAASPLLAGIAIWIKTTTPGSVIFRQRRYGMDGEQITVYKFRTMNTSDDHDQHVPQATVDDERVTGPGRFLRRYSLDELPQLINVLQGRMSIVGPRPHAVAHNEMYRKLIKGYMIRHKVRPGITGLAQVNGLRGETRTVEQMEARVAYDLEYLRSWSLGLDLQIIMKTILLVLRDKAAY